MQIMYSGRTLQSFLHHQFKRMTLIHVNSKEYLQKNSEGWSVLLILD